MASRLSAWSRERPSWRQRYILPLTFLAGGLSFLVLPSLLAPGADAGAPTTPRRLPSGPPVGFRDPGHVDAFRAADLRNALARIAPDARGLTFETSADGRAQFVLNRRTTPSAPELHAEWDDLFIIQSGYGVLYHGGRLRDAVQRTPKEWAGGTLDSARATAVGPGDVVRIPAGIPHVVQPIGDAPLVYLVVKGKAPEKRLPPVEGSRDGGAMPASQAPPQSGGFIAKPKAP